MENWQIKKIPKQKTIMEFIVANNGATHTQIRKLAFNISHPNWTFDSDNRGYYNSPFNYFTNYGAGGWIYNLCTKQGKKYFLNKQGLSKLKKLQS
jgi:hypothetical protein